MDNAALVSIDISRGAEIVSILERANIKVVAALWVILPEYEDWRLVLASRQFDATGLINAYGLVRDSLAAAGYTRQNTPVLFLMPTTDPFIRGLRRIFGKAESFEGMRVGGRMIGDRFIEDGYVYRIS